MTTCHSASQADLTTFLETYRSDASGYQLPIAAANGAQPDQNNPSAESNLDVQTTVSATYPLVNQFVSFRQSTADGFAEGMQVCGPWLKFKKSSPDTVSAVLHRLG